MTLKEQNEILVKDNERLRKIIDESKGEYDKATVVMNGLEEEYNEVLNELKIMRKKYTELVKDFDKLRIAYTMAMKNFMEDPALGSLEKANDLLNSLRKDKANVDN